MHLRTSRIVKSTAGAAAGIAAGVGRASVVALLLCVASGCQTVEEVESGPPDDPHQVGDFSNPAASEGQFDLDSELCWEAQGTSADSPTADEDAWRACMQDKGWTRGP